MGRSTFCPHKLARLLLMTTNLLMASSQILSVDEGFLGLSWTSLQCPDPSHRDEPQGARRRLPPRLILVFRLLRPAKSTSIADIIFEGTWFDFWYTRANYRSVKVQMAFFCLQRFSVITVSLSIIFSSSSESRVNLLCSTCILPCACLRNSPCSVNTLSPPPTESKVSEVSHLAPHACLNNRATIRAVLACYDSSDSNRFLLGAKSFWPICKCWRLLDGRQCSISTRFSHPFARNSCSSCPWACTKYFVTAAPRVFNSTKSTHFEAEGRT